MCKCSLARMTVACLQSHMQQPGNYLSDQPKMRKDLYKSFQMKTMTLFPLKKRRRNKELNVKTEEEILVYCHCRMPELRNTRWVQCSHCENWFHIDSCVNVPPESLQPTTGFVIAVRKLTVFLYNNGLANNWLGTRD